LVPLKRCNQGAIGDTGIVEHARQAIVEGLPTSKELTTEGLGLLLSHGKWRKCGCEAEQLNWVHGRKKVPI
jgi:hypothetical protein